MNFERRMRGSFFGFRKQGFTILINHQNAALYAFETNHAARSDGSDP